MHVVGEVKLVYYLETEELTASGSYTATIPGGDVRVSPELFKDIVKNHHVSEKP